MSWVMTLSLMRFLVKAFPYVAAFRYERIVTLIPPKGPCSRSLLAVWFVPLCTVFLRFLQGST